MLSTEKTSLIGLTSNVSILRSIAYLPALLFRIELHAKNAKNNDVNAALAGEWRAERRKLAIVSNAIDCHGLVAENCTGLRPEQLPCACKEQEVQGWRQPNERSHCWI